MSAKISKRPGAIKYVNFSYISSIRSLKSIVIILILLSQCAYSQRHRVSTDINIKADSLELAYEDDSTFKTLTDTLPLIVDDDNFSWRDIRLLTCFYKNSSGIQKIEYRNGREGYYYFYFEGTILRKLRIIKNGGLINIQYYFTPSINIANAELINTFADHNSRNKEYYHLYLLGKDFFYKYKSLLND